MVGHGVSAFFETICSGTFAPCNFIRAAGIGLAAESWSFTAAGPSFGESQRRCEGQGSEKEAEKESFHFGVKYFVSGDEGGCGEKLVDKFCQRVDIQLYTDFEDALMRYRPLVYHLISTS
jgi:hypothetical protein